jgi:hypothetical protein
MRSVVLPLMLGLLASSAGQLPAQERGSMVPEGTKFVVTVDLDAFRASEVGGQLFQAATQAAVQELGDDENGLEKIREAIGFDPLTEIHSLTVFGSDFEDPEDNVQLIVRLGDSTGNLEGMILGLPGYEADTYKKYTIHSASPDDDKTVHGAIFTDDAGGKSIVAASQRSAVEAMLDALEADSNAATVAVSESGAFVNVNVLKLPLDQIGDGPQASVAKLMKEISVTIGEADGQFNIELRLGTEDEQKAEQIRQMAQGLVAMIAFVQDEGDEDLERVQQLLRGLVVERNEASVRMNLKIPSEQVVEFLREEADLPL